MAFMTIRPKDTLFFRGGKPFTAGENSWTDSSFLPNPSVIWGAMFSVLFSEKKVCRKNPSKEAERLKIENIYLYNEKNQTVLIPAPLDIFTDDYGKFYLPEYEDVDFVTNYPLPVISLVKNKNVKPIENSFLEISSLFNHYLNKYSDNMLLYNFEKVFIPDSKIGIKRKGSTKASEDNHLYRIDLTQFQEDWAFLVEYEFDGPVFSEEGLLKLGGEGKTAFFRNIDIPASLEKAEDLRSKIKSKLENHKYLKVLFKTASFFEKGWTLDFETVLSANVGKPLYVGGYDMAKKQAKPMKKYIPPGSVYVFNQEEFNESILSQKYEPFKGFGKYELLTI
jgi:CRISPR-associated protein Cmr3